MSVVETTIEKEVLKALISNKEHLSTAVLQKLKQNFFIEEKDLPFNTPRSLFTALLKYFMKYQDVPSEETIAKVLERSPYSPDQQRKILTLFAELKLQEPPKASFQFLVDDLKQTYKLSLLKQAFREGLDSLEQSDADGVVKTLRQYVFKVETETQDEINEGSTAASADDRWATYQEIKSNPTLSVGLPTGFPSYDSCTGGLKPGELHIIAAKSSEGKSAMLLNVGYNVHSIVDKSVLYVSIEMPKVQLERRFDALDGGLSYEALKFGKLSAAEEANYQLMLTRQKARKSTFYIYDIQGACTSSMIATKIQELSAHYNFDLIIVDYLNILQADEKANSNWEEQGKAAEELRRVARTLKKPILTAVQINREGMKKGSDRYEQQHIALSQLIVNHSDAILSMKVVDAEALEVSDVAELNCWFVKNRDGARKSFRVIAAFDKFKIQEPTLTVPSFGKP